MQIAVHIVVDYNRATKKMSRRYKQEPDSNLIAIDKRFKGIKRSNL